MLSSELGDAAGAFMVCSSGSCSCPEYSASTTGRSRDYGGSHRSSVSQGGEEPKASAARGKEVTEGNLGSGTSGSLCCVGRRGPSLQTSAAPYRKLISTRRLRSSDTPSGVATSGSRSPRPLISIAPGATPSSISMSRIAMARLTDSTSFIASAPTRSVCPITIACGVGKLLTLSTKAASAPCDRGAMRVVPVSKNSSSENGFAGSIRAHYRTASRRPRARSPCGVARCS